MLGIGPKLWETIHRRYYRYNPASPPHLRVAVSAVRADLPPRADGIPRMPASGDYYEAIDKLTHENQMWMAIDYNGRADRVLHMALDNLTAASHSPNPSTQVSDR